MLKTQKAHPPHTVSASKRFGKYKKEEGQGIRQLEVRGDELQRLRQRRELLRSMTPAQVMQVIEFHKYVNPFEAPALARKEGKIIVPNYIHDRILTETKEKYGVWTGTFVIYEDADKPFGEKVVYGWEDFERVKHSISTPIPERFRGKTNCALVVEHPDFDIVAAGNGRFELKADENNFYLLENFPKETDKWYEFDEIRRIPIGSPKRRNYSLRRLDRFDVGSLGLVARDVSWDHDGRRVVILRLAPYFTGVALF